MENRAMRIFEPTVEEEKTTASSLMNQLGLSTFDRQAAEDKSIWSWYSDLRK
jgi:hypothetical protein